jgi:glycosyltransferase involved in cell wall biosynthesis
MITHPIRRVCFLTTSYPRWANDHRGTFIRAAALALQRNGVTVRVVTVHAPGAKLRETMDGVDVWRIPYAWPFALEICQATDGGLPEFWKSARWGRVLVFPFFAALCAGGLLGARGCQIIHAHWTLSAMACWLTNRLHRKPYLATVHGSDIYQTVSVGWMRPLVSSGLRGSRAVIAVSQSLANEVGRLGIPAERIKVIANGVDRKSFHPGTEARELLLVFCGSLIRRKGADILLSALPSVRSRHEKIQLAVIGDGPELGALLRQSKRLGLEVCVQFMGSQPQKVVGEWMRKAALFILPSREEGQGVAALEAIACGTPCVASRVGGIPEYLAEDMGQLVPANDPAALASAVNDLLDQPQKIESMRQHCLSFAEEHLVWNRIAQSILSQYNLAVE